MKEKEVNLTASQKISSKLNDFIGRHAKLLVAIAALVIVLIIVLAVALTMMQSASEKKFNSLLDLEAQYSSLSLMSSDDEAYQSTADEFIKSADALIASSSLKEYPGAKAELLLADLAFSQENYQEAADHYRAVADAQSGSYLAEVAIMNEAACYDNLGDQAKALELYNYVFDTFGTDSAYAPKALFNAGRLYEAMGDTELAKASFEQLTGLYLMTENGTVSEYARLAQSHLVTMN